MKLSKFKFNLPSELIALHPAKNRDESRLMVVHRDTGEIEHREFKDILDYYGKGDVFIFNNTKVFPARLYGNKEKTGARIEVFLLRELNEDLRLWDVLVDPARKIRIGNKLYFGEDDSMVAEVIIRLRVVVRSVSYMTGTTTSLRRLCMPWARLRCLSISNVRWNRKTRIVIRIFLLRKKVRLWLLLRDCILAVS